MKRKKETIESIFAALKVGETKDIPFTSCTGVVCEQVRQNNKARLLKEVAPDDVKFSVSRKKKMEGFCTIIRNI